MMDQLQALHNIGKALVSSLDTDEVLRIVLRAVTESLAFDRAVISLVSTDGEGLRDILGWDGDVVVGRRVALVGGEHLRAQVLADGVIRVVRERDVGELEAKEEEATGLVAIYGPLVVEGHRIGVIGASRRMESRGPLSERDIELFDLFCTLAGIALQGVKTVEREHKKTTRLWAVNEVGRRASEMLELGDLLREVVTLVRRAFGYQRVSVMLVDEQRPDELYRAAYSSDPEEPWLDLRVKFGQGMIGWCAQSGQTQWANDTSKDHHFFQAPGPHTGSELDVPLRAGSRVIGVLSIEGEQAGAFDDDDVPFVETLADQIAIAIRNSQLYGEARQQAQQLDLINSVARRMGGVMPPGQLMPYLVYLLYDTLHPYSVAIFLRGERDDTVVLAAAQGGKPGPMPAGTVLRLGAGIVGHVAATGKPYLARDVGKEPQFLSYSGLPLTKSEMAVPIRYGEEIIGVLDVQSSYIEAFDTRDVEMLQTLADQVAIAIKNARLFEDLSRQSEQLAGLHKAGTAVAASLDVEQIYRTILLEARESLGFDQAALAVVDRERHVLQGKLLMHAQGHLALWDYWERSITPASDLLAIALEGWLSQFFKMGQVGVMLDSVTGEVLRVGEEQVGVLLVGMMAGHEKISREAEGVLQTFANQAAVAIAHARTYAEAEGRAQRLAEANEQLAQLHRVKSQFLSMVSHELRTPLGLIKGYAETLQSLGENLDEATQRECLTVIQEEADNLSELVDNLLSSSRLEQGTLGLDLQPLRLPKLLEQIVREARQRSPSHQFALDLSGDLPLIRADERRLRQVLRNLLDNAVKYSQGGTLVTVSAMLRDSEEVEISVTDQGQGIAPAFLDRIFERFYRVDQSDSRFGGGAGLGLSIAKGIVEGHGGRITVTSTVGVGSVFRVMLPRLR